MTQLQILVSELQDKMEYFHWLIKDIKETMNQIDELKANEVSE